MLHYKLRTLKSQINTLPNGEIDMVASLSDTRLGLAGLTAGAEAVGDILGAVSFFTDSASTDDWRVRLSIPNWISFKTSPALKPLTDAGGLVFPYTPDVSIASNAKYSAISTTHSNYQFQAYDSSNPGTITITAPMNVEDSTQALYWIAALHYCRSVTKMFSGYDLKSGNPPPVVFLNGYGSYVFKNIPVAITSFQAQLPKDCDYISCDPQASVLAEIGGIADSIGSLSETLGSTLGSVSGIAGVTNGISAVAGAVSAVTNVVGAFGVGGSSSAGKAYVPTKSTFTITLQPMYSRSSVRRFSLDRFVQGGYTSGIVGYI